MHKEKEIDHELRGSKKRAEHRKEKSLM
ncbi:hypothetical protein Nmel_009250 [Mimus melanotis]